MRVVVMGVEWWPCCVDDGDDGGDGVVVMEVQVIVVVMAFIHRSQKQTVLFLHYLFF